MLVDIAIILILVVLILLINAPSKLACNILLIIAIVLICWSFFSGIHIGSGR
jgi:hypothetical protein